jgi:hypothetical protein
MIAKQYTIKLPADYDMGIIRERVRAGGPRFDHVAGLAFKAFLITEGETNRYAPFYVWHDTEGTNDFLYGRGFAGLEAAFGRPRIEHWISLGLVTGEAAEARSATREDFVVAESEPLADVREREEAWLQSLDRRRLRVATVALDPTTWTLVCFAAWDSLPENGSYEVLHLSMPDRDALGCKDLEAEPALARPRL